MAIKKEYLIIGLVVLAFFIYSEYSKVNNRKHYARESKAREIRQQEFMDSLDQINITRQRRIDTLLSNIQTGFYELSKLQSESRTIFLRTPDYNHYSNLSDSAAVRTLTGYPNQIIAKDREYRQLFFEPDTNRQH